MPLKCTQTILIPSVILVLLVLAYNTAQKYNIFGLQNSPNDRDLDKNLTLCDPATVYNLLQLVAYACMAIIIMRLKLFFAPQLCIVAALLGNKKVIGQFPTYLKVQ